MRWLKRIGIIVFSIVVLLVIALAGVYGASSRAFSRDWDAVPLQPITVSLDSATIARGRHVATAITKCVDCHTPSLGGQVMIDDPAFGYLPASNLTTGRGGVLANYTDAQLARAIRHGVAFDGRPLLFMPSVEYSHLTDRDLVAVIAFIRSMPPADNNVGKPDVGPLARVLFVTGRLADLVPARIIDHDMKPTTIEPSVSVEYGRYLARTGACEGCHGPGLSGGKVPGTPPDFAPATNITPAGIGSWTESDFFRSLREGKRPDGSQLDDFMPWRLAGQMTDDETRAVWLYLQSVPARPTGNR